MKQWRVDNYIIGPAIDAEYDDTADKLAEVLNSYERKGYKIQEIIEVREGFFRIIYTSEDDYIEKYEKERDKTTQLESKISILQSDLDKLQEYQALIEDYKKREKILEQRVQDLCENPFIQQAEERGNIYRKFQD